MEKKIRGLYRRGNTFWFAHQKDGRRHWVSLETNDYQVAVARLNDVRPVLDERKPPPAWKSVYLSKGTYWARFRVCLNTSEAVVAARRADEITAAVQRTNL